MEKAREILLHGGVIVFPSESSYGLAADATNTRAVKKTFVIKGREAGKTPPLIVSSFAMAERFGVFSPRMRKLAKAFWPGPLTLVVPARKGSGLSSAVVREGKIALRVSSSETARSLSRAIKKPITATSANRAGKPACFSIESCNQQFASSPLMPDMLIDGGILRKQKPSTIVEEDGDRLIVHRQGALRLPRRFLA